MKIFYHGTTLENAREIQKQGLIPNLKNRYKMKTGDNFKRTNEGKTIFVTELFDVAKNFATFRVQYEQAKHGSCLDWEFTGECRYIKTSRTIKQAIPAIVKIALDSLDGHFVNDSKSEETEWKCECSIPAKHIIQILDLEGKQIA